MEDNWSRRPAKECYRPVDTVDVRYAQDLGDPGRYPFTRGIYPEMYRRRLWTMRQYAGYGDAEESNRRYRYLLSQGTTGLSVAFDLPTQLGLDSDHPSARGEVGRVGVAIDTLNDARTLLHGIPLEQVSCSMTINSTAVILLAFYLVTARRQGVEWKSLRGTIQNDILKEYVARGTYIYPPAASMRLVTDLFGFCFQEVPQWNTISISGYHIREAGATAAQELAFTFANASAYVEAALSAGLSVDEFAPRISFFFSAHNRFLEEIAKFRAARKIWARLIREKYRATDSQSWALRFHAQTAGSTLTAQQPENNVVRVALQALASILGGAQSLHTNARDEALALPTEHSARLALRTQQVLAYEAGIADVADPLGGSWCLERLTKDIEEEVEDYLRRIRDLGGPLRAIETGFVQGEIQNAAYRQQLEFEKGQQAVVGVNRFTEGTPPKLQILRIHPDVESLQIARLRRFRETRNRSAVKAALEQVSETASSDNNLLPVIISAVEAGATLGEIADSMREVFGEHREVVTL